LRAEYGTLDRVSHVLKIVGFINSATGFEQLPAVIDGTSAFVREVFGEGVGRHARSSVGVSELPQGAAVLIEMVVGVQPTHSWRGPQAL
jgi:enamine deaminase RidA (YjgF/YER057c/UK114 family)